MARSIHSSAAPRCVCFLGVMGISWGVRLVPFVYIGAHLLIQSVDSVLVVSFLFIYEMCLNNRGEVIK